MQAIETSVHIGPDGVLRLEVPVSEANVDKDVILLLLDERPACEKSRRERSMATYGSCADFGLEEPLDFLSRPIESS